MQSNRPLQVEGFYKFYQLLTVFSAMYDKTLAAEYHKERQAIWQQAIELSLSDIACCHELWLQASEDYNYGMPSPIPPSLLAACDKALNRSRWVLACLHRWILIRRLPPIFRRCELGLAHLYEQLLTFCPLDGKAISSLQQNGQLRLTSLEALAQAFSQERQCLSQRNYMSLP